MGPTGSVGPMGPMGPMGNHEYLWGPIQMPEQFLHHLAPENLEPQKLKFRNFFQCLGTNGHPIAPKILKTRHSKFLKGLIQQRSTLGSKNRFILFFVKYIYIYTSFVPVHIHARWCLDA